MIWTNTTRTAVPDWVTWIRRADEPTDIVGTTTSGDVERNASTPSNFFRDSNKTVLDASETTERGLSAITITSVAVEDVSGGAGSATTVCRSGSKNADKMRVSVYFLRSNGP
jgi:hypothetical protein